MLSPSLLLPISRLTYETSPLFCCSPADLQQPMTMLPQGFANMNISGSPGMMPIRPPTSPLMAGPIPGAMGIPNMMTGTMGMSAVGIPPMMNQGMMGMPNPMGMSVGLAPVAMPPKQDAFANFANFSK